MPDYVNCMTSLTLDAIAGKAEDAVVVDYILTGTSRYLNHLMRKPRICICETKGADQLRSNCEADQRLCFRYTDRTIPLHAVFAAGRIFVFIMHKHF